MDEQRCGRFFDGAWQGARILGLSSARLRGGKGWRLGILRSSRRRAPASGILNVRDNSGLREQRRGFMKINHAILHVFDFVSCVNVYAQEELDL